jgi:DNA-binding transcriptional ArsR family regulator
VDGNGEKVARLTDPTVLRGIAHPLRLALVGLLRREGPLTATQASAWLGEPPQKLTFHLGQLAKYGLVEEAGGGRGRERPWRATADLTQWASAPEGLEMAAASEMLESVMTRVYFDLASAWIKRKTTEPKEWQEAAEFGDRFLFLTAAELRQLREELGRSLERYLERNLHPELRPDGSRAVTLIQLAFPAAPHPGGDRP